MFSNYESLWKAFIRPTRQTYSEFDLGNNIQNKHSIQILLNNKIVVFFQSQKQSKDIAKINKKNFQFSLISKVYTIKQIIIYMINQQNTNKIVKEMRSPSRQQFREYRSYRHDFELKNRNNKIIKCSLYEPMQVKKIVNNELPPDSNRFPCVVYCHGNSGCRLDAIPYLDQILQRGMGLFCFDFYGSGMSEGEYVTLGYREQNDLADIIMFLRDNPKITALSLLGRSFHIQIKKTSQVIKNIVRSMSLKVKIINLGDKRKNKTQLREFLQNLDVKRQ